MSLPRALDNLIKYLCKKNHTLEWGIQGGEDSDFIQITMTWKKESSDAGILNSIVNKHKVGERSSEKGRKKKEEEDEFKSKSFQNNETFKSSNEQLHKGKKGKILKKQGKIIDQTNNHTGAVIGNKKNVNGNGADLKTNNSNESDNKNAKIPDLKITKPDSLVETNSQEKIAKHKKKNPFKKVRRDNKAPRKKGKLHLVLSMDYDSCTDDTLSDFDEVYRENVKRLNNQDNNKANEETESLNGSSIQTSPIMTEEENEQSNKYQQEQPTKKQQQQQQQNKQRQQHKQEKEQSLEDEHHEEDEISSDSIALDVTIKEREKNITDDIKIKKNNVISGWAQCPDCCFSGFCDYRSHKDEYMQILMADNLSDVTDKQSCSCNVCNEGAVHNGCVFRELVRLKNDYKLFDKRNLCSCSTCIPFKYRTMCLRQELRTMRRKGNDIYFRLTYEGDDGRKIKKVAHQTDDSDDSETEMLSDLRRRMKRR